MAQKISPRTIVVCLVLGLGTVALYSPAFAYHFVNFDDQVYVTGNPHVNQGLTAAGLSWAFQTFYTGHWQPLAWLSHMVDCQIFGPKAGGHHATSLLLHALSAVLLFLVLRRMTDAFWRSAVIAAFFAWHPLHVESVAWIAARKDVLSGFFWMLALWAYVRYAQSFTTQTSNSKLFYALALVFFALGLMVEPILVTFPFILLLLDWWPLRRLRFDAAPVELAKEGDIPGPPEPGMVMIEKIPFVLLSMVSCVITAIAARHETVSGMLHLSFKNRVIAAGRAYFHYLEKTVWPSDLGPLYPVLFHRPKVEVIAIGLFLLVITALAIRYRNSRPYWMVGWFWFVGMLVPALNFFHAGDQTMSDSYMYLPSIGLFILICWEAGDIGAQWPAGRLVLGTLAGLALAGCCIVTSLQLRFWKSENALLSRIADSDFNYIGHATYASYLMGHNRLPEAQAECEKAVRIMPRFAPLQAMLGQVLFLEHKYDNAIERFQVAQQLDPGLMKIHVLWGRALLGEKHLAAAASEFQTAINAEPKNFEARNWLGIDYVASGKTAAGAEQYRLSIALEPNQPDVLNDLAWILATNPDRDVRNGADAMKFAAQACVLTHGTQPVLLGTLAAAYAEAGRFDDAIATAQQAHDVAAAESAAAKKANEPAVARANQTIAERNLQLMEIYRSHRPFREKAFNQSDSHK